MHSRYVSMVQPAARTDVSTRNFGRRSDLPSARSNTQAPPTRSYASLTCIPTSSPSQVLVHWRNRLRVQQHIGMSLHFASVPSRRSLRPHNTLRQHPSLDTAALHDGTTRSTELPGLIRYAAAAPP